MAKTRRLKFLRPRGIGTMIFATGATADVPEHWASRFLADGSAEETAAKAKAEPAEPKADKPKTKKK